MNHWALGLSYHGARFHGWQRQREVHTVQGELEQALTKIANQPVTVVAAGRTDAGVHATGQVVSFVTSTDRESEHWLRGANGLTSEAVRIEWVTPVAPEFHARYSATARAYHYVFHDHGRFPDPQMTGRVWHCHELDADAMHRAAQYLLGEHDFSTFRAAGCQSTTAQRRVNVCSVRRIGQFVVMHIEANAFVLHMVRNIASALHDVGQGRNTADIADLLALRDRSQLGITAPPDGLYLTGVRYPDVQLGPAEVPAFIAR